jgi:hypothetical protein
MKGVEGRSSKGTCASDYCSNGEDPWSVKSICMCWSVPRSKTTSLVMRRASCSNKCAMCDWWWGSAGTRPIPATDMADATHGTVWTRHECGRPVCGHCGGANGRGVVVAATTAGRGRCGPQRGKYNGNSCTRPATNVKPSPNITNKLGIDTIDELITEFKNPIIPKFSPLSTQAD